MRRPPQFGAIRRPPQFGAMRRPPQFGACHEASPIYLADYCEHDEPSTAQSTRQASRTGAPASPVVDHDEQRVADHISVHEANDQLLAARQQPVHQLKHVGQQARVLQPAGNR
eukprot:364204-Chlamydomonas_euryale.AAC.6